MSRGGLFRHCVLCAAVVAWASAAAIAQPPVLPGKWSGFGEFRTTWMSQHIREESYNSTRLEERLRLANRGIVVEDPRLLRFDIEGVFGQAQEIGSEERQGGSGTTLLGYSLDGRFLPEKPHNGYLFAYRDETSLDRELSGHSWNLSEGYGGLVRLERDSVLADHGWRDFTNSVGVREEMFQESTEIAGNSFRRDDSRTIVEYSATKGFETSDFRLDYEWEDVQDAVVKDADYMTQRAVAVYSLDFGPTLNRQLESRASLYQRDNHRPNRVIALAERLRLDHSRKLATLYGYEFTDNQYAADRGAQTHGGSFDVHHRLYENLNTELSARGGRNAVDDDGRQLTASGSGSVQYERRIPWDGRIFAGGGGGYEWNDQRFDVQSVSVIDEPYTVPDVGVGTGIVLRQTAVDPATIVVFDVRDGASIPTTVDIDYLVVQTGDETEIIPLSSGNIFPGDPLQVSYAYRVPGELEYSTTTFTTQAGVDFPIAGIYYRHEKRNEERISGVDEGTFLNDRVFDEVLARVGRTWENGTAEATARYSILDTSRMHSNQWRFGQRVTSRTVRSLRVSVNSDQGFTHYRDPVRNRQTYGVHGAVHWTPPLPGLSASTYATFRALRGDDGFRSDTMIRLGVRMGWVYRRLRVESDLSWADWREREADALRLQVRVVRQLF